MASSNGKWDGNGTGMGIEGQVLFGSGYVRFSSVRFSPVSSCSVTSCLVSSGLVWSGLVRLG